MCGIQVYYSNQKTGITEVDSFVKGLKSIVHRGPDGEGMVLIDPDSGEKVIFTTDDTPEGIAEVNTFRGISSENNRLMFGHRRLSIIETSTAGHQPMQRDHLLITFNGEIYNYIELRNELTTLGYHFKTKTDTEVILAAYEAWQEKCLEKFNGMFAFAIHDHLKRTLFIACDRFGVKPLYYFKDRNKIILASELKQFKFFPIQLTINTAVFRNFMGTAYIDTDDQTCYSEICRVPKAHYCILRLDGNEPNPEFKSYYSLPTKTIQHLDWLAAFSDLFTDAIKIRLRSDVPVGFASSGGLDSSSILYKAHTLLKNSGQDIHTFSAIFPGLEGDESEYIRFIESNIDVRSHYTNPLETFTINDFEAHMRAQDMPVSSTSYYAEWCVARLVHSQNVKVLLIGQGGDELLAGYHHHFYRYCRQLILNGQILKYLRELKLYCEIKGLVTSEVQSKILNEVKLSILLKTGLSKIHHSLEREWNKVNKLVELLKLDLDKTMLPTFLRSDDRDGMAFSLETRHPFLDYRLVDLCFQMPDDLKIRDGWQKWILRETMKELPEKIRYRRDKKGYTTPQQLWIKKYKNEFNEYLNHIPEELMAYKSNDAFINYSVGAWFKINNY